MLRLMVLLACAARVSSAPPQNGTLAAPRSAALRGAADASERPALASAMAPMVAKVTCPVTHRDKALMDACLRVSNCAWSEYSGCRDWSDTKFCSEVAPEDCLKEVIHHGGSKSRTVHCKLVEPAVYPPSHGCAPSR